MNFRYTKRVFFLFFAFFPSSHSGFFFSFGRKAKQSKTEGVVGLCLHYLA